MARASIAITSLAGSANPANPGSDISLSDADSTNHHQWVFRAGDMLLAKNTLGSPQSITLISVADPTGRTLNETVSIGANADRIFGPFNPAGWEQSDGTMQVDTTAATTLKLAVIRPPAN